MKTTITKVFSLNLSLNFLHFNDIELKHYLAQHQNTTQLIFKKYRRLRTGYLLNLSGNSVREVVTPKQLNLTPYVHQT